MKSCFENFGNPKKFWESKKHLENPKIILGIQNHFKWFLKYRSVGHQTGKNLRKLFKYFFIFSFSSKKKFFFKDFFLKKGFKSFFWKKDN